MIKLTTLTLLFCAGFSSLLGQNNWKFSPSVSLGFSGEQQCQKSDSGGRTPGEFYNLEESKVLPSFSIGFAVERSIGKRWALSCAAQYNYIQRFDRTEYTYFNSIGTLLSYSKNDRTLISHQVQMPLQLHFHLKKTGFLKPYLSAGAQASYSMSAKQYISDQYFSSGQLSANTWDQEYDLSSEWSPVKRFNISPVFGVGVVIGRVSIELNRVQNVFLENHDFLFYPYSFDINATLPPRRIHNTAISIKYAL